MAAGQLPKTLFPAAMDALVAARPPARIAHVPLEESLGRVTAGDILARVASPRFTNAAVDGFAVRHRDVAGGKIVPVVETVHAGGGMPGVQGGGGGRDRNGGAGTAAASPRCARVMTGSVVPSWADTVIPLEWARSEPYANTEQVSFSDTPQAGANIRAEGEDIAAGALLLPAGARIDAQRILALAQVGIRSVPVFQPPNVALIATGDELRSLDEVALAPGEIYASSAYFLAAACRELGFAPAARDTVGDSFEDLQTLVSARAEQLSAAGGGVLLTTGGVSVGDRDFTSIVAKSLDFIPVFHGLAIKPGKPIFAARRGILLWLGLPGNPIATAATYYFLAEPILREMAGLSPRRRSQLPLKQDFSKPKGVRWFLRGRATDTDICILQGQGSAHVLASARTNAYIELPENITFVPKGTLVDAILFDSQT